LHLFHDGKAMCLERTRWHLFHGLLLLSMVILS
jgi:hypothetical protein